MPSRKVLEFSFRETMLQEAWRGIYKIEYLLKLEIYNENINDRRFFLSVSTELSNVMEVDVLEIKIGLFDRVTNETNKYKCLNTDK